MLELLQVLRTGMSGMVVGATLKAIGYEEAIEYWWTRAASLLWFGPLSEPEKILQAITAARARNISAFAIKIIQISMHTIAFYQGQPTGVFLGPDIVFPVIGAVELLVLQRPPLFVYSFLS